MDWTPKQKQVIDFRNGNLLVSAAAGSGKTAVLVERIIEMLFDEKDPIDIDELLVVTFTNAAASQMKEKIALAIEKKIEEESSNERYVRQLNMLRDANILTIDSFCYKVLKEYFHVISIDPKIAIAEEADLELIKQEVMEEIMEEFYEKNKDFVDFSNAYSSDKADLNIEDYIYSIYQLSESYPFPQRWFCDAKNNLHVENEEDLLKCRYFDAYIKLIQKNAQEIREEILSYIEITRGIDGPKHYEKTLLSDVELVDSIISSKAYRHLNELSLMKFSQLGRSGKSDEFDASLAEYIKSGRDKYKKKIAGLLKPFALPVEMIIKQAKEQERLLSAFIDASYEFSKRFREKKVSSGFVGFSDVEHFAMEILCSGTDESGRPIPSKAGKELASKFREILIDEYQDSNYLQEYILQCVSKVYCGENNIFMVGDVKQSIYGFRMARPDLFTQKYDTYSEAEIVKSDEALLTVFRDAKILLNNNFRSRKNVLDFINYIFYQIMDKSVGGIDYNDNEALVAGRDYAENSADDVELLLGESKEASMLETEGADDKDEHLDDEYIDVSSIELEAGMVAERIKKLVGTTGSPHMITDENTGEMRPVKYKDIVILFRAPKRYQPVFSEVLMKQNIPVKLQNENGYFDLVEIKALITMLKMIDNPYNDVECAALLRGYYGRLDSNELAVITLMKRYAENHDDLYMNMYQFVHYVSDDKAVFDSYYFAISSDGLNGVVPDVLFEKCKITMGVLTDFQKKKRVESLSEIIENIYYDTGYFYYVEAMPDGKDRSRNLMLFLDEAKRYEKTGVGSLFDFLRFVKKISEKDVSLGGDASNEITEDMVRIMSIHKSKGLEFPVVFVSGLGKAFNLTDTKSTIILHSDYYVSAKFVDPIKRCGNDTFARKAVASLIRLENIAEELRIFYVALTRAKEKLILTGVTPDIPKLIGKKSNVYMSGKTRVDYGVIKETESYLDFVISSLVRNRVFHDAMENVRARYDKKGNIVSGKYDVKKYIDDPKHRLSVSVFYYNDMVSAQIDTGNEQRVLREEKLREFFNSQSLNYDILKANLGKEYDDIDLTVQKSKMSVTEIKRLYSDDAEGVYYPTGFSSAGTDEKYKEILPRFASGEKEPGSAEKGTWFHKVMELIDNTKLTDGEKVKEELERLYSEGRIPEETRSFIVPAKITSFVMSDIGKRMMKAALDNKLYKERKFVVGFPVKDGAPEVVVQGIIDAYFEEDGKLILLDYKTDNIKAGQEEKLITRYRTQMEYYRKTLEKVTGLMVSETYIYSFALDKQIKM